MKQCIFFGAGNCGQNVIQRLKKTQEFAEVLFWGDSDRRKEGKVYCSIPIVSAEEMIRKSKEDNILIVITQVEYHEAENILKAAGVSKYVTYRKFFDWISEYIAYKNAATQRQMVEEERRKSIANQIYRDYLKQQKIELSQAELELLDKRYESEYTHQFIVHIAGAHSFVDVGGEFGYYSMIAAQSMPAYAEIYIFEPEMERFTFLNRVFQGDRRVKLFNHAVSNVEGSLELFSVVRTIDNKPLISYSADRELSLVSSKRANSKTDDRKFTSITAKSVTLDKVLAKVDIDVVKMDIEGAEVFALDGMRKLLLSKRPKLFIEMHDEYIESLHKDGKLFIQEILQKSDYCMCYNYRRSINQTNQTIYVPNVK